jgi:hypothetical protein
MILKPKQKKGAADHDKEELVIGAYIGGQSAATGMIRSGLLDLRCEGQQRAWRQLRLSLTMSPLYSVLTTPLNIPIPVLMSPLTRGVCNSGVSEFSNPSTTGIKPPDTALASVELSS